MFFAIPSQPMDHDEESTILLATGCSRDTVELLQAFAEKYRQSISEDNVQKNRKLGTRSLVRIARRLAMFPDDKDELYEILGRCLLAEFLPATERMNLEGLLEGCNIGKKPPMVRLFAMLSLGKSLHCVISTTHLRLSRAAVLYSRELQALANRHQTPRFRRLIPRKIKRALHPWFRTWTISTITACKPG